MPIVYSEMKGYHRIPLATFYTTSVLFDKEEGQVLTESTESTEAKIEEFKDGDDVITFRDKKVSELLSEKKNRWCEGY